MSSYSFLINLGSNISSSVEVSNFIPNRKEVARDKIKIKFGVYTQALESCVWQKLDEVYFENNNNINLNSIYYELSSGQLAVVIPVSLNYKLDNNLDSLPEPYNRHVDGSPVEDRMRLSFRLNELSSSYQGDFPYMMSKARGTFIAFDPLVRAQHDNVRSKLVLVNIHSNRLHEKNIFHLFMANLRDKKVISCDQYRHNSVAILDIDRTKRQDLFFYSKETLGLPIFISYDEQVNSLLSVEHTNPPSELFFNDQINQQKHLKTNWFSKC